MASQACPNCQTLHDTKVYVRGQKLLCRCGIRFEVQRNDVSMMGRRSTGAQVPAPLEEPFRVPPEDAAAVEGHLFGAQRATDHEAAEPNRVAHLTAVGGAALNLSADRLAPPEPGLPAAPSPIAALVADSPIAGPLTASPIAAPVEVEAPSVVPAPQPVEAPLPAPEPSARQEGSAPTQAARPVALAAEPFAATAMRGPDGSPAVYTPARAVSDLNPTVIRAADKGPEIPGYQLLDVLGRGGMGEVWRARQLSLDRMVAVKLLPQSLSSDREFVARFEKEAQALASLSHPNIIQIIDRGVVGSNYFFVMEFVQGRSLRELMGSGPAAAAEALRLIIQICHAIDYAHDQGIIHRDLKPENILLDERNHVKVADFGLASFVGNTVEKANLTATSVAMGTINYMAPEQRRDAKSVDGRADLYSLGVILYELLTGELPLGRFKLPSERAGMDARLDRIIIRALETDPEARYARASHIGVELEALISGSASWPAAPTGRTSRPVTNQTSVIQKGWSGIRYGLTLIGALTLIAVLLRGPLEEYWPGKGGRRAGVGKVSYPPNTNLKLLAAATVSQKGGLFTFESQFEAPPSEAEAQGINANDGLWKVEGGKLIALQAGNVATKTSLRPRAYLSRRYFTSDDFSAEVQMTYQSLHDQYGLGPEAQVFEELSFRIAGSVTVSVFAIPGKGVRLLWAYDTVDGVEVVGNSAQDANSLLDDEIPPPPDGVPFTVRLTLKRQKGGTLAEAFVNNQRVGRKLLVGLMDTTGKLALGCRNLHCEFEALKIAGKAVGRPKNSVAQGD
ncbi:MAG: protein kinase [Myxococcota bacterium]|nr:protein kinase [Myxococcota bacterium]